ncbi:MAG: hypothetical protein M1398_00885 [Deltaproteobacteria bacterium]|nr:hypothetical protein [Deltaproteobacteria bacterium]MDA8308362.1 hypothetical protein [Deltaproteobacteria bacterium]
MAHRLRLEALQAEISAVDALLKEAIEVGDPVGEYQLSKRKGSLETEISNLLKEPVKTASVALFFGGKPVFGSRGVSVAFAGNALRQFQELVSKVYATFELGRIGERGPIPLKQATDLMVTEIAKGSFGFVLDELQEQLEMFDTDLKKAVQEVATLLERTASPNEIDFEEALETLDPRTLFALKEFFATLDSSNATVRLVEDKFDFTLDEPAVHRARERTEATSIDEAEELVDGILVGFLPQHRKFEAKTDDGVDVYGSVTTEAAEQYESFVSSLEIAVGKRWRFKIRRRTVRPVNRPPRVVHKLTEFLQAE